MIELRTAVIGAGDFGAKHARVFSELDGVEVAAVADLDLPRAQRLADAVGARLACRSVDEALAHGVDAVSVACSPSALAEQALVAARVGVPVLVEKPVAMEHRVVADLAATAEAVGVLAVPGYVLRFCEPYRQLRDEVRSGRHGRLLGLWTRQWRGTDHITGIHPVHLTGVHHLDLARWLTGGIRLVSARAVQRTEDDAPARLVDVNVEWDDGTVSSLTIIYAGEPSPRYRNNVEVLCSDGVLCCEDPDPVTTLEGALRAELAAFVSAVRGRSEFPVAMADAAEATMAAEAIEQSARNGGRVVSRAEVLDAAH